MRLRVLRNPFNNSLLAIMVGAIGTPVSAVEIDVGQGESNWTGETFNESLTITGKLTQAANLPVAQNNIELDAVSFSDVQINGALINRADIVLDAQGGAIRAFAVDPISLTGTLPISSIAGDVIQSGRLIMNDGGYTGFAIGGAKIGGSVINSGTIQSTPSTSGSLGGGDGIYLHGTIIAGDVSNTGVIDMVGDNSLGIALDRRGSQQTSIGGKILNTGTLSVKGNDAWAFEVETSTTPLRIENSGLISASGSEAKGIAFFDGTVDSILNSGTIEAKGENTKAFDFKGATFVQNSSTGSRGIINRGTISADGTAIFVDAVQQISAFEINQQSGEIRSNSGTAIDAAHLATLNWTGGKIVGDVLNVNAVNISGQADFVGNRIVSPVSISAGSLNLLSPGTTLTGDLNVASSAGIDMRLANNVVPTMPYMTVNGVANFALASNVTLSANPNDFTAVASGTEYTLVYASSVQNNGLTVGSSSPLLEVFSYSTDAQTVKAVVGLKSNQRVSEELSNVGATEPVVTAINELKNNVLGQLDVDDPVFKALASTGTAQRLAQIGEQLKPDVNRGALDAALSGHTVVNGAIRNRLASQRDNRNAVGVWLHALNSNMDQDGRSGSNGYSANSSGTAVGVDSRLNDNATIGAAYSYLNSNIHSDLGSKTEVEGHILSLYGNWSLQSWFVDSSLSYGHNSNDSKRNVVGTTAKGNYGSDVLSASALSGYSFKLSDAVLLEPRVVARYSAVRMDGFNETGSSAALSTGSQHYEVGELGAGIRLAGKLPLPTGSLQPETILMAYHDLIGDPVVQTSRFMLGGSAFSVKGASVARDSYEVSVGLSYQVSELSVGASYVRQSRSGFDSDEVMLKARYAF